MKVNGLDITRQELRKRNLFKYKVGPSWDRVWRTLIRYRMEKKMGTFEIAFGMTRDTLSRFKTGKASIPAHYWHLFYDDDELQPSKPINQPISPTLHKKYPDSNKGTLNVFKQQL